MPVKTRAAQKTTTNEKKKPKASRTPVGSTVEGYTIPQVRKSLDLIRRSWGSRGEGTFSLTKHVSESDTPRKVLSEAPLESKRVERGDVGGDDEGGSDDMKQRPPWL